MKNLFKNLICAIVILSAVFSFSACGETKFSGTWEIHRNGECTNTIEFIDDEECVVDDEVLDYKILEDNRISLSDGWADAIIEYEIIDKDDKVMEIIEYDGDLELDL